MFYIKISIPFDYTSVCVEVVRVKGYSNGSWSIIQFRSSSVPCKRNYSLYLRNFNKVLLRNVFKLNSIEYQTRFDLRLQYNFEEWWLLKSSMIGFKSSKKHRIFKRDLRNKFGVCLFMDSNIFWLLLDW